MPYLGVKNDGEYVMAEFCAGKPSSVLSDTDYDAIAQVAVSIELVHKASILLDDYIDGDTARHGMEAFHVTYGPERTMLFSLIILCRSLKKTMYISVFIIIFKRWLVNFTWKNGVNSSISLSILSLRSAKTGLNNIEGGEQFNINNSVKAHGTVNCKPCAFLRLIGETISFIMFLTNRSERDSTCRVLPEPYGLFNRRLIKYKIITI